jgi:O-antigen ligase
MKREQVAERAGLACRWALFASIALAPTQLDIARPGGAHLTLADLLLSVAAVCWAVRLVAEGEWWRRAWPLPWPVMVFLLPALLSMFMVDREGVRDALREVVKLVEYFVAGYILYDDLLRSEPRRLRTVLYLVLGSMIVVVMVALGQYLFGGDPVRAVCGTFKNRNVLGGWLAMMLPIIFGVALYAESLFVRIGLFVLLLGGLLVTLSGAAFGAVLLAILLIAATRGWRVFVVTLLAATCWVAVVTDRMGAFREPESTVRLSSQQVLFRSVAPYSAEGEPERRYPEWQSALEMALTHPWLGEGLGNYQRRVDPYTWTKPRQTGPSEPDIQNQYLVIASTMGLPALFGFVALLLLPALQAGTAAHRHAGWRRGFVYGVTGGIAAFAVTAIWHPLLVRGVGLHLVLLLVVARLLAEWSGGPASDGATGGNSAANEAQAGDRPHRRRHHRRWHAPDGTGRHGTSGSQAGVQARGG